MGWNASDLLLMGAMLLFAGLIILAAEVNDRWQRKGYMYGKDIHADCRCKHRGYEHSYRHGHCRYQQLAGGTLFECVCPAFREAWNTEELV